MAHIASQAKTQGGGESSEHSVPSEELEDSDSSKEGTHPSVSDSNTMSPNSSFTVEEKHDQSAESGDSASGVALEDASCSVKKKKRDNDSTCKDIRNNRSECRGTIKAGVEGTAVSGVSAELVEGCATLRSATAMERVTPDMDAFGRSGSPYPFSENEWEASDHSDTDADHSDSSDDDNPTSQVDRMIERGASLIMDGENSNLSSETDDTDDDEFDDSDSDITDVSPLVSNAASPLGLSPVMCRRNLPSSLASKPPFLRHYSHKGHEGDVEDEVEEETDNFNSSDGNTQMSTNTPNMSLVVHALLKISMESQHKKMHNDNSAFDGMENRNDNHHHMSKNKQHHHLHLSPALQANPHHRHLRKSSNCRRKNMSFTNEEARIIDRDNSIILEKLLAVNNRDEKALSNAGGRLNPKPATATLNRKRKEEVIQKENLVSNYHYVQSYFLFLNLSICINNFF